MTCALMSDLALARAARGLGRLKDAPLRLYKLAMIAGRPGVTDHLLHALEELARSEPACEPILDQAYLWGLGARVGVAQPRMPGSGTQ